MITMVWLYIFLTVLSLCVGSLLNLIIYRLPIMLERQWKQESALLFNLTPPDYPSLNLFFPRSFCPHCQSLIKSWQNIPLLSYFFLRGKCLNCHQPIAWRYPLVEMLSVVLSVYAAWHFGFTANLVFALLFNWIVLLLFFIDIDHKILPDALTISLLWLGLLANCWTLFTSLTSAVIGAMVGYLSLWLFTQVFYLIRKKIGMGNGDFKLFAAFGAWFGWPFLPFILLFSSFLGAMFGIVYLSLSQKSKDTPIAFGPFLCLFGIIAFYWGNPFIHYYLNFWQ